MPPSLQVAGLLLAAAAGCIAQAQQAGAQDCVTTDGFLGDCRPAGSCTGGPRPACAAGQVCCTRITPAPSPTGQSSAGQSPLGQSPVRQQSSFGQSPARRQSPSGQTPAGQPPPRRQGAGVPAMRRPTLLDPPFECGGQPAPASSRQPAPVRRRQSAIVFRSRRRRAVDDSKPPLNAGFVAGGAPEPGTTAVGVGVIGTDPPDPPRRPSLNDALGRIASAFSFSVASSPSSVSSPSFDGSSSFDSPSSSFRSSPSPFRFPGRQRGRSHPGRSSGPARRSYGYGPPARAYYHPHISYYQQQRNYYQPRRGRYQRRQRGLFAVPSPSTLRRHRRSPQSPAKEDGFEAVWREYQARVRSGAVRAGVTREQLLAAYRAAAQDAERAAGTSGGWTCGAVLISSRYMLTAAHCLRAGKPQVVRLGDRDLTSAADGAPDEYRVLDVVPHPRYRYPVVYHDLALLRLDREVTFGKHVRPFCLYDGRRSLVGQTSHVSGWGATQFGGGLSDTLQGGNLTVWSRSRCDRVYTARVGFKRRLPEGITDGVLCAGGEEQDACQGDSGGPMTVLTERGTRLIGVVSAGVGCATPGVPGLYTNVGSYIKWIDSVVFGDQTA